MNRCSIIFVLILVVQSAIAQVTYAGDIAPVLTAHCVICHQPGEIGPMPLTTFDEATAYGAMLAYVTAQRLMPPWPADPAYATCDDQNILTEEEVDLIRTWVRTGMPPGDTGAIAMPAEKGRPFVEPDLVIPMPRAFEQYGIYYDQYQVFVLPVSIRESTWIRAIRFVPGNPRIVRHSQVALASSGCADSMDRWDPRVGYTRFGGFGVTPGENAWFVWNPGDPVTDLGPDACRWLPAGHDLLLYMHYGPTGIPLTDSSRIEFWFCDHPPDTLIRTLPLINASTLTNPPFVVNPGEVKRFHAKTRLPVDTKIVGLYPQAQLACRSWEVFAKLPDQAIVRMLKINDWDMNWRRSYHHAASWSFPAGTEIHVLVSYNNTLENPHNPSDPPALITWGTGLFQDLLVLNCEVAESASTDIGLSMMPIPAICPADALIIDVHHGKDVTGRIVVRNDKEIFMQENVGGDVSHESFRCRSEDLTPGNYLVELQDMQGRVVQSQMFVRLAGDQQF